MKRSLLILILLSLYFGISAQTAIMPIGAGTSENPYQVGSLENLYWITAAGVVDGYTQSERWSKHYLQINNIDASMTSTWFIGDHDGNSTTPDIAQGWLPIGFNNTNESLSFNGVFNGNEYTITGIFINRGSLSNNGFFGYVGNNAELNNIHLINVDITGNDYVGGLAGSVIGASIISSSCSGIVKGNLFIGGLIGSSNVSVINNSHSDVSVIGNIIVAGLIAYAENTVINESYNVGQICGSSSSQSVGGLVGKAKNVTQISNSYPTGDVNGGFNIGGLIGTISVGSNVTNCYNAGYVTGGMITGGLIGNAEDNSSIVSDCYNLGSVSAEEEYGGLIGHNFNIDFHNSYYDYDNTLINGESIITIGAITHEVFSDWLSNNKTIDIQSYLEMNSNNQYIISDIDDFKLLLAFGNNGYSFILSDSLDFSNDLNFYIPKFNSNFDGNKKIMRNLTINLPFSFIGLFGIAQDCVIENVVLSNVQVTGSQIVGSLVGETINAVVKNSNCSGIVTAERNCAGGLIGAVYQNSLIYENNYTGVVNGSTYIGGLVGSVNNSDIISSYSISSLTGNSIIGSLVGIVYDGCHIQYSYSQGSIVSVSSAGGLIGIITNSLVSNSYSRVDIESYYSCGGLIGGNTSGSIINCYSTGHNTIPDTNFGGLVGFSNNLSLIQNSFWDTETSGVTSSSGGIGKTTSEMKSISTFVDAGWDFNTIWEISEYLNSGYPTIKDSIAVSNDEIIVEKPVNKKDVLKNAYPNPFNPTTSISFELISPTKVILYIYNIKGQLVRRLINDYRLAGIHQIIWDGHDQNDQLCSTGMYFYQLRTDKVTQTKKVLLLK